MDASTASIEPVQQHGDGIAPELDLVAVSGSPYSDRLVEVAAKLAAGLGAPWEAIHIETPDAREQADDPRTAAETLALAARLGAAVATIPAATVADGIVSHLAHSPATHHVLGRSRSGGAAR